MKITKIHIAALVGCIFSAMQAWGATAGSDELDLPLYDGRTSQQWLETDVHAGVGLSSVIQNYGTKIPGITDMMLSPGCQFRGGVGVRFNLSRSFGLATGLEFGINNFRQSMSMVVNEPSGSMSSLYITNHFYQFTVPVYVSWRLNIGRRMMWNIDLGMYLSEGAGGDLKASGYTTGENNLGQPVVLHATYKTKYYEKNNPLFNGVRNFDVGAHVATGLVYRHRYTFNAVLEIGARNLAINKGVLDLKYHNLSLMFQIGYIL